MLGRDALVDVLKLVEDAVTRKVEPTERSGEVFFERGHARPFRRPRPYELSVYAGDALPRRRYGAAGRSRTTVRRVTPSTREPIAPTDARAYELQLANECALVGLLADRYQPAAPVHGDDALRVREEARTN